MLQKHKMKKNHKGLHWICFALVGCCLLSMVGCGFGGAGAQKDGTHHVSPEELAFFKGQVERNVSNLSEQELEEAAKQYIREVNAVYWLGSELELCQPFDFETLQADWEKENADRENKRETGEVFYGPDVLSLEVYFPYQYSALQSDITRKILDERDEALVADARRYYEQNPDYFTKITSVTYQSTVDGETTEHTIPEEEFRFTGQSNPELMDFLSTAADGEDATLSAGENAYTVKRLGITTELMDFDENERMVVEMFVGQVRMGEWLEQIAQMHPVTF